MNRMKPDGPRPPCPAPPPKRYSYTATVTALNISDAEKTVYKAINSAGFVSVGLTLGKVSPYETLYSHNGTAEIVIHQFEFSAVMERMGEEP